jgi:hypothetical protein
VNAGTPERPLIRELSRGTTAVENYADGTSILLGQRFRFDPVRQGPPPQALKAAPLRPGETGTFLVQLHGPVRSGWRERIAAAGGQVFAYVPNYTFVVRLPAERLAAVQALPFVRWIGPYHPAYKISPQEAMSKTSGPGTLVVLLYPDAGLSAARIGLEALGGRVLEATDSGVNKILRVSIDTGRISEIVLRNDVAWIEPWIELRLDNADCQWVVQTNVMNNRRVWDMGLHGEGQVVHTSDSGIRTTHFAFRDSNVPITDFGEFPTHRKIIAYQPALLGAGILFGDAAGASYHGTHTAGTLVGDDSPFANDARDGMALKAKIWFHDAGANARSIVAPGDLNLLFQPPYDGNAGGAARISSNSWGGPSSGAYTVHCMTVDQFLWNHKNFLVSFSNGNIDPQTPASATVGSPASNKDGIGSGATGDGLAAGQMMPLTSQGPTADGRIKPTVLAPGLQLSSANGANDTGYQSLTGTSMSSPAGAGAITLIRQYVTEGWYPTGIKTPAHAFVPSGALLKAMAIASTDDDMSGQHIPNNVAGWGRVKVDNILYFPGDAAHTALVDQNDGLATGEFIEYEIEVADVTVPLKVALCWYDKEGSPSATRQLVNDLDLTVTDPVNVSYRGNFFANGESQPAGVRDTLNVEECVRRNVPLPGRWRIRVTGTNVPFAPQPFALVVSGGIGSNRGIVLLDKTSYGGDDVIEVRVEDPNAAGPISVGLTSGAEPAAENLALSGTNGVFLGTIPTTTLAAANGDGLLSVAHGDAITVAYADASPAASVLAHAAADLAGPVITGVGAAKSEISERITWTTDTPASSRVYYGTTPNLGLTSQLDPNQVRAHELLLSGLQPGTDYYFDVESVDHQGNPTRDNAGGSHYRFTAGTAGDILLVIGDSSFGGVPLYRAASEHKGWDLSVLQGGIIGSPLVGNRSAGLRSFAAVWWQVGQEQYPPFADGARDSLTAYLQGGGRFAFCSHDAAWAFTDPASGFSTPARVAWLENQLHLHFVEDPPTFSAITGTSGDPISGAYATGLVYSPIRTGGAGDEVQIVPGAGSGSYIWTDTDPTVDHIGIRWESGAPNGNPDLAVWGGTPTRIVANCFEWTQIVDVPSREDVFDKTLIWLIGRDHPDVTLTSPNGGEVVTSGTTTIAWNETAYAGTSIASRSLYYSTNGGASWTLLTAAAGPPPYTWDVSAIPNAGAARVRIDVRDSGSPALRGSDASDSDFRLDRPGGDGSGPVIVAGSIAANPNPMDNRAAATLAAAVTDAGTGGAGVAAAEWSVGVAPAAAGTGTPMSGAFGGPTVDVSAAIAAGTIPAGQVTFWVRGRDAAGQWGNASQQAFRVNGDRTSSVAEIPLRYALRSNVPNPFNPETTIRFDLPHPSQTELVIYNVRGGRVRQLLSGRVDAGVRSVMWDGRDDSGRQVTSGVYFYRLTAGDFVATRRMVLLK